MTEWTISPTPFHVYIFCCPNILTCDRILVQVRGRPLMIWRGAQRNFSVRNCFREIFFPRKRAVGIFLFRFPPPPQIINDRPLTVLIVFGPLCMFYFFFADPSPDQDLKRNSPYGNPRSKSNVLSSHELFLNA